MHQHLGALDLYVSFFLWRLVLFEYGSRVAGHLDFVQWHQKFFWDAISCKGLFHGGRVYDVIGRFAYGVTNQPARALVEGICKKLIRLYERKLRPLVMLVARLEPVPREVKDYFVPLETVRALRLRSVQVLVFSCLFSRVLGLISDSARFGFGVG